MMKGIRGKRLPATLFAAFVTVLFAVLVAALFAALLVLMGCEQPGGVPINNPAPDSDTTLKDLVLSAGSLSPAFSPEIRDYTTELNASVTVLTVSGTANSTKAVVGGQNGVKQSLKLGVNPPIEIVVTAEDGSKGTYRVTATRLPQGLVTITTKEDLAKIGKQAGFSLAGDYKLAADLVLEDWLPLGNGTTAFTGSFDGAGYRITLKSFAEGAFSGSKIYLGLFGNIKGSAASKAVIKNIEIITEISKTINQNALCYVGAVVAYAGAYTELRDLRVSGNLSFVSTSKAAVYAGGITGALYGAELRDSCVSADISAEGRAGNGVYNCVGGMAGLFDQATVIDPDAAFGLGVVTVGASIVNCHTSGSVSGRSEGGGSNVFVGGIAGGSAYTFKTYYSGKIEDCSSTGNISARCEGGYWAFAGGIAGTIVGDGDGNPATGPTRIARCYATGNVTASTTSSGWPYAGGIVGYNYYGALVSQCYFTGTVIGEGGYDYTGGIAGYNSQKEGHNSIIEDCYSAGEVKGRINGGGIVGQNQIYTYLRRCYSSSAITLTGEAGQGGSSSGAGGGGIAGLNMSGEVDALSGCVALNPSITTAGFEHVHRVIGMTSGNPYVDGSGVQTNNYAWSGMVVKVNGNTVSPGNIGLNDLDGADCDEKPDQSLYEGIGWDFDNVWKMGGEGYPVLRWQD
jgi:hypothetical protein